MNLSEVNGIKQGYKVLNIVLAIIVLGIIIIIHEGGHFLLAKANGVAVSEFCLGFGPTLIKTKKNGTVFSLKLLPFGGACIMAGEDGADAEEIEKDTLFASKSVWARMSIIAAGPIFNFLLAFIMAVFIVGGIGYNPCVVYSVDEGSAAARAGLEGGDRIVKVNNKGIVFYEDFSFYYSNHTGAELNITYVRDGQKYNTVLTPEFIESDVYQIGIQISQDCSLAAVVTDSAADAAGLKMNDIIVSINGVDVENVDQAVSLIRESEGNEIEMVVERNGSQKSVNVKPVMTHYTYYYTGLSFSGARVKAGPLETLRYSASEVRFWISAVVQSLRMLVTGGVSKDDLAGPVGIVSAIGSTVEKSKSDGAYYVFLNLANWVVMLSANLGVMNLLPIPALDGGRLVFLIIEALRGKPIDSKKEGIVHFIGMVFLMILMVFVLFNDISRL